MLPLRFDNDKEAVISSREDGNPADECDWQDRDRGSRLGLFVGALRSWERRKMQSRQCVTIPESGSRLDLDSQGKHTHTMGRGQEGRMRKPSSARYSTTNWRPSYQATVCAALSGPSPAQSNLKPSTHVWFCGMWYTTTATSRLAKLSWRTRVTAATPSTARPCREGHCMSSQEASIKRPPHAFQHRESLTERTVPHQSNL